MIDILCCLFLVH